MDVGGSVLTLPEELGGGVLGNLSAFLPSSMVIKMLTTTDPAKKGIAGLPVGFPFCLFETKSHCIP